MEAKKLIQALEQAGYEPRDYSGRGMFGDRCVAVVVERGTSEFRLAAEVAIELVSLHEDGEAQDVLEELARLDVRGDSMGRDSVIYFPDVAWPAEGEGDDGEGDEASCEGDEDGVEDDAPEDLLQQTV